MAVQFRYKGRYVPVHGTNVHVGDPQEIRIPLKNGTKAIISTPSGLKPGDIIEVPNDVRALRVMRADPAFEEVV